MVSSYKALVEWTPALLFIYKGTLTLLHSRALGLGDGDALLLGDCGALLLRDHLAHLLLNCSALRLKTSGAFLRGRGGSNFCLKMKGRPVR